MAWLKTLQNEPSKGEADAASAAAAAAAAADDDDEGEGEAWDQNEHGPTGDYDDDSEDARKKKKAEEAEQEELAKFAQVAPPRPAAAPGPGQRAASAPDQSLQPRSPQPPASRACTAVCPSLPPHAAEPVDFLSNSCQTLVKPCQPLVHPCASQVLPRWQTRLFCVECVRRLLALLTAPEHFSLALAQQAPDPTAPTAHRVRQARWRQALA